MTPLPRLRTLSIVRIVVASLLLLAFGQPAASSVTVGWSPVSLSAAPPLYRQLSCPEYGFCAAVGNSMVSTHGPLGDGRVSVYRHGTWKDTVLQGLPFPSYVSAVSCTSATYCVAFATNAFVVWDGTTWTTHTLKLPTGLDTAGLSVGACFGAQSCRAAGIGTKAGQPVVVTLELDGTTPRLRSAATVAGAKQLDAISCVDATRCVAVGNLLDAAGQPAVFAATWLGNTVQSHPLSLPADAVAPGGSLSSLYRYPLHLDCRATVCVMSSPYTTADGEQKAFAVTFEGPTAATVAMSLLPGLPGVTASGPNEGAEVGAVSCSPRGSCVVPVNYTGTDSTGAFRSTTLLWRTSGSGWNRTQLAVGALGVDCPTAGRCVTADAFLSRDTPSGWVSAPGQDPAYPNDPAFGTVPLVECSGTIFCMVLRSFPARGSLTDNRAWSEVYRG